MSDNEGKSTSIASRLSVTRVGEDEIVLEVGRDHPWGGRASVSAAELSESAWILREPGSGTRSIFESWLAGNGVPPASLPIALELPSNEAIRCAVEAGAGATVISRLVADSSLRAGGLVQVGLDLPKRPFYRLRHKERHVSHAERAFIALFSKA